MAETHIALLRGINVGTAKRVAMADLRALVESLGYGNARTLLNSGNVVYTAARGTAAASARRIEEAVERELGVRARIVGVTVRDLAAVVAANPFARVATDASRYLVAFLGDGAATTAAAALAARDWSPERCVATERVAYLWCPDGILASPLNRELARTLRDGVTARNWATVTKLLALAEQ